MPRTEIPCNFCFTAENMRNRKFIAYGRIESEVWKIDFCTLPTHNISKRTTILKLSVQVHSQIEHSLFYMNNSVKTTPLSNTHVILCIVTH